MVEITGIFTNQI